jgi:hypothetical protein
MQELAVGSLPGEAALALKARLVVAHLPPHVKLSMAELTNGAAPTLRAGGADIPAGSTAALRWAPSIRGWQACLQEKLERMLGRLVACTLLWG